MTTDIDPLNKVEAIFFEEFLNLVIKLTFDFLLRNSTGKDSGKFL
jgi:hypothetical protein